MINFFTFHILSQRDVDNKRWCKFFTLSNFLLICSYSAHVNDLVCYDGPSMLGSRCPSVMDILQISNLMVVHSSTIGWILQIVKPLTHSSFCCSTFLGTSILLSTLSKNPIRYVLDAHFLCTEYQNCTITISFKLL